MIPASPGPIIFSIGAFSLRWYGISLSLAALAIILIGSHFAKKRNIPQNQFIDAAIITLIMAVIGARILHVINEWWYYHNHLSEIPAIWHGGLALHGALIFGLLTVYFYTKIKKITFLFFTDVAVLGVVVGQAIGRWGNYFNEELFGKPTSLPWGLSVHVAARPAEFIANKTFHPLFLYEMLLNFCLFGLLYYLFKKTSNNPGIVTAAYFMGYSAIRFSLDFLRFDQAHVGPLSVAQWLSAVFFVASAFLLLYLVRRRNPVQKA